MMSVVAAECGRLGNGVSCPDSFNCTQIMLFIIQVPYQFWSAGDQQRTCFQCYHSPASWEHNARGSSIRLAGFLQCPTVSSSGSNTISVPGPCSGDFKMAWRGKTPGSMPVLVINVSPLIQSLLTKMAAVQLVRDLTAKIIPESWVTWRFRSFFPAIEAVFVFWGISNRCSNEMGFNLYNPPCSGYSRQSSLVFLLNRCRWWQSTTLYYSTMTAKLNLSP